MLSALGDLVKEGADWGNCNSFQTLYLKILNQQKWEEVGIKLFH
jgi:hypothetical protein